MAEKCPWCGSNRKQPIFPDHADITIGVVFECGFWMEKNGEAREVRRTCKCFAAENARLKTDLDAAEAAAECDEETE